MKKITTKLSALLLLTTLAACSGSSSDSNFSPSSSLDLSLQDGIAPLAITFDASDSYDLDGHITKYIFDFGDGQTLESTSSSVSYTYSTAGTFYATVIAIDDDGLSSVSSSKEVVVIDQGTGQIELGTPTYSGTGCPDGTVSAVLAPDNKSISLLFDQMSADANVDASFYDRKSCNLAIPVIVPDGYAISVYKIDYRGFASVPTSGSATFDAEYFFSGDSSGLSVSRDFAAGFDDSFQLTDDLAAESEVWSSCGGEANLRVNTSITASNEALITLDSADIVSGVTVHVQMTECHL